MTEAREASESPSRFAGIEIPPDLKWSNFFNMYLATILMASVMIVSAAVQPALLKEVLNVPEDQAGSINAGLMNMEQIATLLLIGLVGILSDKVGRRILAMFGFLVCGVFYFVFGHTKDISLLLGITSMGGQVFVAYIIRFVIGIGIILAFPQFITLVADYTYQRDRGKGMALNGVMMGLGAMVAFGVLAQIARKTGLMSLFYMAGALGFVGVIVSRLWLVDRMPKEKPKKLGMREIYKVVSKSLALKVSYVATFVGRPDSITTATFLILWMVYVADKFGISPVTATAKGGLLVMATGLAAFVTFPIAGVFLDRWGRIPVIVIGFIVGGIGFCLAAVTENPFSPVMYLFFCLTVIGRAGSGTGANTLCSDASPRPLLGSILGGLNTMNPLGVLFFLQVGGFLFDKVGYGAPFALKGIADLACGLWIFAIRKRIAVSKEEGAHTYP
jgi:MFS family permease